MPDPRTTDPVVEDSAGSAGHDSTDGIDAELPPTRKRRRWLKVLGVLFLLVVVVIALAPTIAGAFAPGIIASRINIPGTLEVEKVSLGWFSAQSIGPVTIREKDAPAGSKPIATVTLKVAKGLTSLVGVAFGSLDVGVIEGTGSADIVRHADGSTNLERALGLRGPSTPASSQPGVPASSPTVPESLNATLNLTAINLSFTDEHASGGPHTMYLDGGTITGTVLGASGGNLSLNFSAKATESAAGSGSAPVKVGNGTIAGAAKVSGWLTGDGRLALDQAIVDGSIAISDVPSGIVDAFVMLPNNATVASALGPTVGLTATAKGTRGQLEASVRAVMANMLASGSVTLAHKSVELLTPIEVRLKGDAAKALTPQLQQLMSGAKATPGDVTLSQLPDLVLAVSSLHVPFDLGNPAKIDLRGATFNTSVGTDGQIKGTVRVGVQGPAQDFVAEPLLVHVDSANLSKGATLVGSTRVAIGGQPAGELAIDLNAKGLLDANGAPATGLPLVSGSVRLTGASTALAQAFVGNSGLDLRSDVGPTVDISIDARTDIASSAVASGGEGAGATSGSVDVQVHSHNATLMASVHLSEKELRLESLQAHAGVSPDLVRRLSPGDLRLTQPAELNAVLGATGLTIPLKHGAPDLSGASPLELALTIQHVALEGFSLKGDDGKSRPLGRIGAESIAGVLRADIAAIMPDPNAIPGTTPVGGGIPGKATIDLSGGLLGPDSRALGNLRVSASAPMRSGRLDDAVKVGLALDNLSPEVAQSILPQDTLEPGMLAGALGSAIGLSIDAAISTPGKDLSKLDVANATAKVLVKIAGDRIATTRPITLDALKDRLTLTSPAEIRVSLEPSWVNSKFLTAEASPAPGAQPATPAKALTMLEPAWFVVALSPMSIARSSGEGDTLVGPLKPDVFRMGVDVHAPRVILKQADGKRLEVLDLGVKAIHPPEATDGTINAAVTGKVGAAGSALDAATLAPFNLAISVSRLALPNGTIDLSHSFANVSGDLPKFPSSLLDLFAHQNGSLAEFLGDTSDVRVRVQDFSLAPGGKGPLENALLDASISSPRVRAAVAGRVVDQVFVASAPIEAELFELTPKAGQFINAALPALGSIEKRAGKDRPAKVTIKDLRYPLNDKLEAFVGSFDIDPGEARFASSTAFGEILKVVKQRTEGEVGRRLEPLSISVVNGSIAIPKYNIPLGEFTVATEGTINLATTSVNVVTWIPFGALSDKIAGTVKLNTGLGSAIGRVLPIEGLTMIPFRTTGTFAKTGTTLDAELMASSLVDTVRPDKVIERAIDLIPTLGGRKKEPVKQPDAPPK